MKCPWQRLLKLLTTHTWFLAGKKNNDMWTVYWEVMQNDHFLLRVSTCLFEMLSCTWFSHSAWDFSTCRTCLCCNIFWVSTESLGKKKYIANVMEITVVVCESLGVLLFFHWLCAVGKVALLCFDTMAGRMGYLACCSLALSSLPPAQSLTSAGCFCWAGFPLFTHWVGWPPRVAAGC